MPKCIKVNFSEVVSRRYLLQAMSIIVNNYCSRYKNTFREMDKRDDNVKQAKHGIDDDHHP